MIRVLLLACVVLGLTGCETLSYYRQGLSGQLKFYGARQPIPRVLAREDLSPDVRRRLGQVEEIRRFAREQLALPVKGQYREFVQLDRPVVAHNVFAAPELSLRARRWCYFFHAVCVEYRAYFSEASAREYAARLRAKDEDVHVGGIAAFSTLGLLDDPVTSVLTAYPDDFFVHVLFHELAHSVVYVRDDTVFNESFASAVADAGLARWRLAHGDEAGGNRLRSIREAQADLNSVALAVRADLSALYASDLAPESKRDRKRQILEGARARYRAHCGARAMPEAVACPYEEWFAFRSDGTGINNAKLNAVAAYESLVPAFTRLLAVHGDDFAAFYVTVKAIGKLPAEARGKTLAALLPAAETPAAGAP